MMKQFNPSIESQTDYLRNKVGQVGHWALARWMMEQRYPFHYAYYVIFGRTK